MHVQSISKKVLLNHIVDMDPDLAHLKIDAVEWSSIGAVAAFLQPVRSIMEIASSDSSVTLSMVAAQVDTIVKHCHSTASSSVDDGNPELTSAAIAMAAKLESYRPKLITDAVKIANYLDPRFPKPSDIYELGSLKDLIKR
jgi:hypothetical protein